MLGTQIRARTWKKCIDWKVLVGICTDVEKGHEVLQDLWTLDRLTQKEWPFDCSQNETGDEWMDTGSLA